MLTSSGLWKFLDDKQATPEQTHDLFNIMGKKHLKGSSVPNYWACPAQLHQQEGSYYVHSVFPKSKNRELSW